MKSLVKRAKARARRQRAKLRPLTAWLLENVHPAAVAILEDGRLRCSTRPDAPADRDLAQVLEEADVVGVRSRTKLPAERIREATRLQVIGCFAVGTNNVDLGAAAEAGIPVFHAPHASTRSVAELTLGFLVALSRRVVEKAQLAREGKWAKDATGSHELRGRTLGIVGYGHIGSQVSVLAESLGMRVIFHDVVDKQALGNAQPMGTLAQLLRASDFVTLHVPGGTGTDNLIGQPELALMRPGTCLVNTSRGTVVDEAALAAALESGRLGGAAVDVLREEPTGTGARFDTPLRHVPGAIITPHVGGSTEEAQARIGESVARRIVAYLADGTTRGSVNFPQVELERVPRTHRLVHVHHNVPGVLSGVNAVISELGANIESQYLRTNERIGYLVVDINRRVSAQALEALAAVPETIRARLLS